MLETHTRTYYQKWLVDPIAKPFSRRFPRSANAISIASAVVGLFVPILIVSRQNGLAIVTLILSGYLDTLDGTVARFAGQSSATGTVIDILMDRFVEFVVIFGLFLIDPTDRSIPAMLMLGSILLCVTSFLVVGIFSDNDSHKSFHYSPGLMERAEAFAFFIAMIIFPDAFIGLAYLFIALVLLTTLIRVVEFISQQRRIDNAAT